MKQYNENNFKPIESMKLLKPKLINYILIQYKREISNNMN